MTKSSSPPVTQYDPDRAARRLEGALKQAGSDPRKVERAMRRARADLMLPVAEAQKLGAALPPVRALLKTSWRIEQVDVPPGEEFIEARPAYVVRFDGNAPVERLRRAGVLDDHQVLAAEKLCALYLACVKPPKVTASYDGIIAQGGAAPKPWIDQHCDAYASFGKALSSLLPNVATVVLEVAVYETTIETLAKRRDLVRLQKANKAEGAVIALLSCGLLQLAMHWGLVAGAPQNVAK